ncbi:sigma-70 family RNA polymerase sigma factor [Methylobacterium sp. E-025]|uniref:sigma-70 family RNA polymerase sigma factor n=1 Tax=Methylobacterium sp. E-025 TaxID=2836561 RepID=UPI001FBBA60A|nr:sigma-70 family RNA polymerase sigma factor [Methylobacterium sp. E-025]MCJ2112604.1 sigma-70 family RNA polymerase sigma factor [Methylobacterium sp. E-025]
MHISTASEELSPNEGLPRHVQDMIGRRLDELFPAVADADPETRLGQVLLRLRAALLDAQAERQVSKAFSDSLIAAVPRLRRFAMMRTRSAAEADDLVQATLLKAWEHRSRFQAGTNLVAWLFTILCNAHINQGKRYRREVRDVDGAFAAALTSPAEQEHRIGLIELQTALAELPVDQRETLLLVVLEGLPYEEAALVLGCQPGTVKSRVSRARERLSQILGIA